jgi:hypothetical protein
LSKHQEQEQSVTAGDLAGMNKMRDESGVAVMADESLVGHVGSTLQAVEKL